MKSQKQINISEIYNLTVTDWYQLGRSTATLEFPTSANRLKLPMKFPMVRKPWTEQWFVIYDRNTFYLN